MKHSKADTSRKTNDLRTVKLSSKSKELHEILSKIGVSQHLLGYEYMITAFELIMENPDYLRYITKGLYIDVSSKHNSTSSKVERAIRHAITAAWLRGNMEFIYEIFGHSINPNKGMPTNSHFFAAVYYYMVR